VADHAKALSFRVIPLRAEAARLFPNGRRRLPTGTSAFAAFGCLHSRLTPHHAQRRRQVHPNCDIAVSGEARNIGMHRSCSSAETPASVYCRQQDENTARKSAHGSIYRYRRSVGLVWGGIEGQTWLVKRGEVASREIVAQDRRRCRNDCTYKHLGSSCLPEIPTMEPSIGK